MLEKHSTWEGPHPWPSATLLTVDTSVCGERCNGILKLSASIQLLSDNPNPTLLPKEKSMFPFFLLISWREIKKKKSKPIPWFKNLTLIYPQSCFKLIILLGVHILLYYRIRGSFCMLHKIAFAKATAHPASLLCHMTGCSSLSYSQLGLSEEQVLGPNSDIPLWSVMLCLVPPTTITHGCPGEMKPCPSFQEEAGRVDEVINNDYVIISSSAITHTKYQFWRDCMAAS